MKKKISINRYLNTKAILMFIIFVAAFLRIYKLDTIPPHLTPDEAALGYNAYSILKTGRDEYGELLPIIFKSFGDYKPGLYVYLTVPFVALFGLTEFAVRLPSALAGVVAVGLIYAIVLKILKQVQNDVNRKMENDRLKIGLIAAFLLAINPWHIHFSRGAWEANLSLTLTLAGIYFFLKTLNKSHPEFISGPNNEIPNQVRNDRIIPKFSIILTSIFFALTYITYQGAKVSTTLVIVILFISFYKEIFALFNKRRKTFYTALIIGFFICTPVILSFFSGGTGRLEVFSVFSYPRSETDIARILTQGNEIKDSITYNLFHSEALSFKRGVLERYFNHFSSDFLFFVGDWQNPRHSAPYHGMMLTIDSVLLVLGTIHLIKRSDKVTVFIFLWLLLAPLPAALSRDQVQAVRSLNMLVPLVLIAGFGFYQIILISKSYKNMIITRSFLLSFIVLYVASFIYFLDAYFIHLPVNDAQYWLYGYKQTFLALSEETNGENTIIFQQSYAQPYIFYLFYNKVDPNEYQDQAELSQTGIDVGLVSEVENIDFVEFSWPPPVEKGDIVVGDAVVIPDSEPDGYKLISEIDYPNGQPAFRIVKKL